jgi:hypothetical protein
MLALLAAALLTQAPLVPGPVELEDLDPLVANAPSAARLHENEKSTTARIELVGVQSLHGLMFGLFGAAYVRANAEGLLLGLLGVGLGAGASVYATRDGVTPGEALTVNSGTTWGLVTGAFLGQAIFGPRDRDSNYLPVAMVGGLIGTATAAAINHFFTVTSGQAALVNSAGLWSLLLTSIAFSALSTTPAGTTQTEHNLVQVGTLAGSLALGMLAAGQLHPSRLQMFLSDLGGVLGLVFGLVLDVLVGLRPEREPVSFIAAPAGMAAVGAISVAWLARDF